VVALKSRGETELLSPAALAERYSERTLAQAVREAAHQRGFARSIGERCKIGAFEYPPYALYLPLVNR